MYGARSAGTSSLGRRIRPGVEVDRDGAVAVRRLVVDEHGTPRRHIAQLLERRPVDRGIRLHRANLERQHDPIEHLLEPEPVHDGPGRERAVADERGLDAAIAQRREGREHVVVEVDAALEVRALELDQLVDERPVVGNPCGLQDGGHVALHAPELAHAARRTRLLERLLEPVGLHPVADPGGDGVAHAEPLAPHDRVVQIQQDGVVSLGHVRSVPVTPPRARRGTRRRPRCRRSRRHRAAARRRSRSPRSARVPPRAGSA